MCDGNAHRHITLYETRHWARLLGPAIGLKAGTSSAIGGAQDPMTGMEYLLTLVSVICQSACDWTCDSDFCAILLKIRKHFQRGRAVSLTDDVGVALNPRLTPGYAAGALQLVAIRLLISPNSGLASTARQPTRCSHPKNRVHSCHSCYTSVHQGIHS